jgi:hypothetical protein
MRRRIRFPADIRLCSNVGFAPFVFLLAALLAGCGSTGGNANLGPDPGGGFYCPHNAFEGCANP